MAGMLGTVGHSSLPDPWTMAARALVETVLLVTSGHFSSYVVVGTKSDSGMIVGDVKEVRVRTASPSSETRVEMILVSLNIWVNLVVTNLLERASISCAKGDASIRVTFSDLPELGAYCRRKPP